MMSFIVIIFMILVGVHAFYDNIIIIISSSSIVNTIAIILSFSSFLSLSLSLFCNAYYVYIYVSNIQTLFLNKPLSSLCCLLNNTDYVN